MPESDGTIRVQVAGATNAAAQLHLITVAFDAISTAAKAVLGTFDGLVESYSELEARTRQLQSAVGDSGLRGSMLAIEKAALRTGETTDDLTGIFSDFAEATDTSATANAAFTAVLDLSSGKFISAARAHKILLTSFRGETSQLEKLMLGRQKEIEAAGKISEAHKRQAAILRIVQEEYGGASREINQGVTAWRTLKNTVGDTEEALGGAILASRGVQTALQGAAIGARALLSALNLTIDAVLTAAGAFRVMGERQISTGEIAMGLIDIFHDLAEIVIYAMGHGRRYAILFEGSLALIGVTGASTARLLLALFESLFSLIADSLRGMAGLADLLGLDGLTKSLDSAITSFGTGVKGLSQDLVKLEATLKQTADTSSRLADATTDTDAALVRLSWSTTQAKLQAAQLLVQFGLLTSGADVASSATGKRGKALDALAASQDAAALGARAHNAALRDQAALLDAQVAGLGDRMARDTTASGIGTSLAEGADGTSLAEGAESQQIATALANVSGAVDQASSAIDPWAEAWSQSIGVVSNGFAGLVGTIASGSVSLETAVLDAFGSMASSIGQVFIATGIGMINLRSLDPLGLIAAGAGLVALSALVGSIGGGGGNSGSSGAAAATASVAPIRQATEPAADQKVREVRVLVGPLVDEVEARRYVDDLLAGGV